jgi:hypothetical protein
MDGDEDPRIARYENERDLLAQAIQKRQSSSSIGRTVPWLGGDAERAANSTVLAGWTPPLTAADVQAAIKTVESETPFFCVKRGDSALLVETVLRGLGLRVED